MNWKRCIKHPTFQDVVLFALVRAAEELGKKMKRKKKEKREDGERLRAV